VSGVVARDPECQSAIIGGGGGLKQPSSAEVTEQGVEGVFAPGAERGKYPFGMVGFRRERISEEAFQVPPQLSHQVAVGPALDGPFVGRGDLHRVRCFERFGARDLELWHRIAGRRHLLDDQVRVHIDNAAQWRGSVEHWIRLFPIAHPAFQWNPRI
jgi:hypothetical protein